MESIRKYWHLIAVIAGVSVVFALIYVLRNALLPFLIGFVVIYVMKSVVSLVEKRFPHTGKWGRWLEGKRVLSILVVNTVIVLIFGILGFYIFNTVVHAFSVLLQDATEHWAEAVATLQQLTDSARQLVPNEVRGHMDAFATNIGKTITDAIEVDFKTRVSHIPETFSTMLGLAVLPFFVFYILKDKERLSNSFYAGLPTWAAEHVKNISLIIENTLGRYVRATLTLGMAVGALTLVGLLIIRAPAAPLLAVVAGVTEMIPTLGPWLGGAIALVVTLALAPGKLVFVVILFVAVQLLENNLLVPRIQSGFLGLAPGFYIVLLVVGAAIAGVWGLLLTVPLAATAVQIYRYIRQVVREQNSAISTDG